MRGVSRYLICGICTLGLTAAWPAPAESGAPNPVSPGRVNAFAPVASACPTFSWTGVDGAAGYELVVYEAPGEGGSEAGLLGAPGDDPVLRTRIRGRGLSWTPPADGCLDLAGSYAWAVRALEGAASGEWSEAALFRVEPAVAAGELAAVVERVLGRYLEKRGLEVRSGELATLISQELAGRGPATAAPAPGRGERYFWSGGERHVGTGPSPGPRGVFNDEVELWLEESGSGLGDKVQLVFATPEFDGDAGDAWAIIVDAYGSALDPGKMFFSTPSFFDALQLFTDGTAIVGEQREMKLQLRSSPPIACTSFLQEGMFYWDEDVNTLCVCDGTSWEPIDSDNMVSCS